MATMTETVPTKAGVEYWHDFHAEANLLSGELKRPIEQKIIPQGELKLRGRSGGYSFQRVENYSLEGLITIKSGYTRVAGFRSIKKATEDAWVTLATSVLEGFNVLDVLTADRIVTQISTEHAKKNGHVPKVTFLGTQFQNLKVSGYEVKPILNLNVCRHEATSQPLLLDGPFLKNVQDQYDAIPEGSPLADDLQTEYKQAGEEIKALKGDKGYKPEDGYKPRNPEHRALVCSLVSDLVIPEAIPGATRIGKNLLHVEEFGTISFGHLTVGRRLERARHGEPQDWSNYFTLKMLEMHLGCAGHGTVSVGSTTGNGRTKP